AHLDGLFSSNLDLTGLSQKYGAVTSHVRMARAASALHATRIAAGEADALIDRLKRALGLNALVLDAQRLAAALLGDVIASNMFMLGAAWQKGLVPIRREAIDRAIELNGVAIEANKQAFDWGRRAAHDPASVETLVGFDEPVNEM